MGRSSFCVQRKSIFGFWYNPDNKDGHTTGWYDTLKEAMSAVEWKLAPCKTIIHIVKKGETK